MYPIHFGTLWGIPVCLAVLSVTRLLMYWNRYLAIALSDG